MQDTEETTTVSRRVSSEFVALWRRRSTSSLIEESFSMRCPSGGRRPRAGSSRSRRRSTRRALFGNSSRNSAASWAASVLLGSRTSAGALKLLDEPRGGRALAGAGGTHEDDVLLAVADARGQLFDGLWLVARGRVRGDDLERIVLSDHDVIAHGPSYRPGTCCAHKAHGFATSVECPGLVNR